MPSFLTSAVIASAIAASVQVTPVQTQPERDQFVSACVPRMSTRVPKQPELVCGCLHDNAVLKVDDAEIRVAVMRGIAETGVPTVQYSWVPTKTPEFVLETLDKVAAPSLACMFSTR